MQLYPFQEIGTSFLMTAGSALLADEMGCGKGPQALMSADLPCLVICPNSMSYVWKEEWTKWRPDVSVVVLDGTLARKKKLLDSGASVVIVNWESLRVLSRLAGYGSIKLTDKQKEPGPLNRPWSTVIADEAHRAKDPHSQQTRALWAVGNSSGRRVALTGTPIANSPVDLWSVMHFVSPEEWPSRSAFIDRYCVASFNFWGTLEVHQLRADTRAELDSFFLPRFLRRTKAEVLPQLPAKTYQTRYVTMTTPQAKVYESLRKDMIAKLENGILLASDPLTQTLRLLQTASALPVLDDNGLVSLLSKPSCKVDALKDLVDEVAGEPMVVFAASRKLIELCYETFGEEACVLITGAQTSAERAAAVAKFQTGTVPLALVTLGAGGEGITLTAASRAVFLQRSWSLVQNLQAEDRIHRIGQSAEAVQIIDIITSGTVEEKVHQTFSDKELILADVVRDPKFMKDLLL